MYDIIIVGAGPAGLTAAIYATRASKKVLVLESRNYGGSIISTLDIENYPVISHISGYDFATNLYNQVKELGAEIILEKVVKIKNGDIKEVITSKNTYKCKSVIIATGTTNRKLGLINEDNYLGKGLSYCATCDGAFYKNKVVAVVGGGNSALEDALYLTEIAKEVYLIHHKSEFQGEAVTISKLKQSRNIHIIYNSKVTKINGIDKITDIEITNIDNNKENLNMDGLFIAIGRVPENDNFKELINLDKFGYIEAGEDCHTNVDGIFVAGDNRTKEVRQLVTATSDGAVAAMEAIKYINKKVEV